MARTYPSWIAEKMIKVLRDEGFTVLASHIKPGSVALLVVNPRNELLEVIADAAPTDLTSVEVAGIQTPFRAEE